VKTRVPINSADARRSVARFGESPRTTAVPLLPTDLYGQPEWQDARRSMIGASEMAAVLGRSPYASPFSLWWSKQNGWDIEQTMAMYLGHLLEPVIAGLFAEQRPDLLICRANASLWQHPAEPFIGATPDYLAVRGSEPGDADWMSPLIEPVECKSDEGGQGWGRPGTDEVPEHHRIQVLQQCAVFGARQGHLVRVAGKRYSSYVVDADPDRFAGYVDAARSFVTSVELGMPPDVDDHKATTEALERLYPDVDDTTDAPIDDEVAAEYERLRAQMAECKGELRRIQNLIRHGLSRDGGNARFGVVASTGRRFVDRRVYKRSGYEVAPTMVDALYPIAARGPKHAAPIDAEPAAV
jgi:putative phage-type endonuclease